MENILEIRGLTKSYPGFCLDSLSFSIPSGSIVGFIGENGAGKTTVMKLILHALERDSGEILVFGKDNRRFEKEIKQDIGVVQDECNLPRMFSAADIQTVMKRIYRNWDKEKHFSLLEKFSLPRDKAVSAYSRGMKLKLSYAVALAHGSKLLLLDEATDGLDPAARDEVLDMLLDFVQDDKHSVLFSTHMTNDLAKIADYIAFLHQGRLLFFKSKDELIYNYGLLHCGEKLFRQLDSGDILAWRRLDYEYQVLTADCRAVAEKHRGCLIDHANLDDIMLIYIGGETECRG